MLLKHLLTPDDPAVEPLGTLWLALTVAPLQASDDGDSLSELVAPSYTRVGIGALDEYWTLTSHGVLSNATPVYWPAASGEWGLVTGWALCTEATSGLVIAGSPFMDAIHIGVQQVVALAPGMLVLEIG